jgi:phosphoribosylaminoimidazole synthetase
MRAEGRSYVGVLYAGLMLDPRGPQVLEFNCRFGDPETQVLLPLLKSDLLEIAMACVEGRLAEESVEWSTGSAACVVLASGGYPGKYTSGEVVRGLENLAEGSTMFHAGTKVQDGEILTAGGRVLVLTGWAETLVEALAKAYQAADQITFAGKQFRRDIAQQAIKPKTAATYAGSGVNIDAGNRAVAMMSAEVKSTYTPNVLAGIGAYGGLFAADFLKECDSPVLVASTDGVGTKVKMAASLGRCRSIGLDIVNHCINDILVQGARPLFFLDYFATSVLKPEIVAQVVAGISEACRAAGCVLLGGETAEMPGVYVQGEFDVAGTIVGIVERAKILPRTNLQAGDVLVGLASSGPHTNGFSLIRRVFDQADLNRFFSSLNSTLGDALLAPHRSYYPLLSPILDGQPGMIKALAHLTGGGYIENIPRILPEGLSARVRQGSWPIPALFKLIQERGGIETSEMFRVFNLGIGMVVVLSAHDVPAFRAGLGEESWVIGELCAGERKVILE